MNKYSLLTILGLFTCGILSSLSLSAAPLLHYEFNQPGATQQSSGSAALDLTTAYRDGVAKDYITTAPVQRQGASNNSALNFTAANVNINNELGYGTASAALTDANAAFLRGELESFTISMWVLDLRSDVSTISPRIFGLRNASGTDIISLQFAPGTPNKLTLVLNGVEGQSALKPSALTVPTSNDTWFFLSITYDATSGLVSFYGGSEGESLFSESAFNTINGEVNTLLGNASILGIGGLRNIDQRRTSGYLSDVRFYGEALSAQQIGELYAIPEPTSLGMLGASALLIIGVCRWRRGKA